MITDRLRRLLRQGMSRVMGKLTPDTRKPGGGPRLEQEKPCIITGWVMKDGCGKKKNIYNGIVNRGRELWL